MTKFYIISFFAAQASLAQSAVILNNKAQSIGSSVSGVNFPSSVDIDLNNDGINEFTMFRRITRFDSLVAIGEISPNTLLVFQDRLLAPLAEGVEIGPILDGGVKYLTLLESFGTTLSISTDERPPRTDGPFANQTAYLGFQFKAQDGIHYGYALIQDHDSLGATIHETGWETIPGKAILTGAVPEPSTSLLALGAMILGSFSRRRSPASA